MDSENGGWRAGGRDTVKNRWNQVKIEMQRERNRGRDGRVMRRRDREREQVIKRWREGGAEGEADGVGRSRERGRVGQME